MRLSIILPAVMASVAIASPVPEEAPAVAPEAIANDAGKSSWEYYNCESSWLNPRAPNKLNAKCQRINDDGTYTMVWSELDLNKCVINDNGELKWKSGGLGMDTCDNCSVFYQHSKHAALAFNCFVPSKPAKRTMVHLDEAIYNKDRILGCFGHSGRKTLGDGNGPKDDDEYGGTKWIWGFDLPRSKKDELVAFGYRGLPRPEDGGLGKRGWQPVWVVEQWK